MLTYPLTKTGGVSLYEQLYRRIKDDILTGRLAAGEKLPSKRALAAHLEVSVITVKGKSSAAMELVTRSISQLCGAGAAAGDAARWAASGRWTGLT